MAPVALFLIFTSGRSRHSYEISAARRVAQRRVYNDVRYYRTSYYVNELHMTPGSTRYSMTLRRAFPGRRPPGQCSQALFVSLVLYGPESPAVERRDMYCDDKS
eukprot:6180972-Pleurochrysis_carterae.AAC.2